MQGETQAKANHAELLISSVPDVWNYCLKHFAVQMSPDANFYRFNVHECTCSTL
jgi:hypothetical protein